MTLGMQVLVTLAAAAISAGLIVALKPLLVRYALARPNARSSHAEPTPQGGGIAVVLAIIIVVAAASFGLHWLAADPRWFGLLFGATVLIAITGATDDIRTLAVVPRLALQAVAVAMMLAALPDDLRVAAMLPWWVERALMLLAGLWFVNLTNFMDGIDWMTVAEVVPVTAALGMLGWIGALPPHGVVVALALCGALIGFAPFNRPVARLFLGDVGSLPVGLLLAWLLVLLAGEGHVIAALMLPLYYAADATVTLALRLYRGERVWEAHRSHFYQRATANGFSVHEVVARVFAINVLLAFLAVATVRYQLLMSGITALIVAAVMVGGTLWTFARGKPG